MRIAKSFSLFVFALSLASCLAPGPIKVGYLAGLTGPVSELGLGARRGLDLVVRDLNAAGGINGRLLEVVAADDGNDPAQGVAAYRFFQTEGVCAVIGPVASTVVDAILPVLNAQRLPTISPTVSAASVEGLDDWFFRVITVNKTMGKALGDYAVERGLLDLAVLRETSNGAYTGPILEQVRSRVEAAGGRLRTPVEFDMRQKVDFAELAGALGDAPAYLFLVNGYDAALVGQQLAGKGHLGTILSPPWAMTADVVSLGGRQVERMVFVSVYDTESQTPGWRAFRDSYWKLYGEEPGFAAVYAADAFTLLAEALRRSPSTRPEDLRAALVSLGTLQGLQSEFHLDSTGDVERELFLLSVRGGRFVRADP